MVGHQVCIVNFLVKVSSLRRHFQDPRSPRDGSCVVRPCCPPPSLLPPSTSLPAPVVASAHIGPCASQDLWSLHPRDFQVLLSLHPLTCHVLYPTWGAPARGSRSRHCHFDFWQNMVYFYTYLGSSHSSLVCTELWIKHRVLSRSLVFLIKGLNES